jgi:hypothetical protein
LDLKPASGSDTPAEPCEPLKPASGSDTPADLCESLKLASGSDTPAEPIEPPKSASGSESTVGHDDAAGFDSVGTNSVVEGQDIDKASERSFIPKYVACGRCRNCLTGIDCGKCLNCMLLLDHANQLPPVTVSRATLTCLGRKGGSRIIGWSVGGRFKRLRQTFVDTTYGQDLHTQSMHENEKAAMIWEAGEKFDPHTEQLFTYVQVFTACLNSFAHGASDVSNAIAPSSAIIVINQTREVYSALDSCLWFCWHRCGTLA